MFVSQLADTNIIKHDLFSDSEQDIWNAKEQGKTKK